MAESLGRTAAAAAAAADSAAWSVVAEEVASAVDPDEAADVLRYLAAVCLAALGAAASSRGRGALLARPLCTVFACVRVSQGPSVSRDALFVR